jgi:hypothetical protein
MFGCCVGHLFAIEPTAIVDSCAACDLPLAAEFYKLSGLQIQLFFVDYKDWVSRNWNLWMYKYLYHILSKVVDVNQPALWEDGLVKKVYLHLTRKRRPVPLGENE